MKIYTSYFSNRQLNSDQYTLVSIARSMPKGVSIGLNIDKAKPSWQLLNDYKNNKITWEQYTEIYTKQVTPYLESMRALIHAYAEAFKKPVVLLCWEGKGKDCHRHILARLLREAYGMEVEEL